MAKWPYNTQRGQQLRADTRAGAGGESLGLPAWRPNPVPHALETKDSLHKKEL